jgi:hypothetical protein
MRRFPLFRPIDLTSATGALPYVPPIRPLLALYAAVCTSVNRSQSHQNGELAWGASGSRTVLTDETLIGERAGAQRRC